MDVTVTTPSAARHRPAAADQFTFNTPPDRHQREPDQRPDRPAAPACHHRDCFTGATAVNFGGTAATPHGQQRDPDHGHGARRGRHRGRHRHHPGGGTSATSGADQFTYNCRCRPSPVSARTAARWPAGRRSRSPAPASPAPPRSTSASTPATRSPSTSAPRSPPRAGGVRDRGRHGHHPPAAPGHRAARTSSPTSGADGDPRQPDRGPTAGGTTVRSPAPAHRRDRVVRRTAATAFTVDSATQITATLPPGPGPSTSPSPPRRAGPRTSTRISSPTSAPDRHRVSPTAARGRRDHDHDHRHRLDRRDRRRVRRHCADRSPSTARPDHRDRPGRAPGPSTSRSPPRRAGPRPRAPRTSSPTSRRPP